MSNRTVFFVTVLLICISFVSNAAAERRVFKGQYIFTPKNTQEISAEAAEAALVKRFNVINHAIGGVKLATKARQGFAAEALGEPEVIPYQESEDECLKAPLEGFHCEPNWHVSVQVEPTDSLYKDKKLWGLNGKHGINAPGAWRFTTGGDVVVAVIDTGTNFDHPDLAPNIWRNPREVRDNGKDDDGNGVIDDSHGFNAVTGRGIPRDDNGHGSHVAGTVCAYGSGGGGLVGVAWNCKILTIKFLDGNGGGSLFGAIEGINYMVKIKRQYNISPMISNNSWGGGGHSEALKHAIERARNEGIIFVVAAGNSGKNTDRYPHYPSCYKLDNLLRVGAISAAGVPAAFSNYGEKSVDISAPGVGIYSASHRGSGYVALSGTSMAAPHVSGVLALLLSREGTLTHQHAIARVIDTGRELDSLEGKNKTESTLDALRALTNQISPTPGPAPDPGSECKIRRFKRCKRGCREQYQGRRRMKNRCIKKCRKVHACPLNWKNLLDEWFTWSEAPA